MSIYIDTHTHVREYIDTYKHTSSSFMVYVEIKRKIQGYDSYIETGIILELKSKWFLKG